VSPTRTATPTITQTASITPTPTITPTPSVTLTPTDTPAEAGPQVSFLAPVDADGCFFCCSTLCQHNPTPTPAFDGEGRQIYERGGQNGFFLVVEGKAGVNFRQPGMALIHPSCNQGGCTGMPDLQIMVSNDLGQGSGAVCDTGAGGDGVPGVDPADFFNGTQAVLDAANDLSCRFIVNVSSGDACTRDIFGVNDFQSADTTRQYCAVVTSTAKFPVGDTIVSVQLRDSTGVLGPRKEIVIRVTP